jgi:hypothetical protein
LTVYAVSAYGAVYGEAALSGETALDGDGNSERIVVRLPLRLTTVTRLLGALAAEFTDGRWVDDPDGHLAIEVPKDVPDDEHLTMVRIDDVPGAGERR